MKIVGILLSLLVSATIIYLTVENVRSYSKGSTSLDFTKPIEKAKSVQPAIDLSAIQLAVQAYETQHGSNPKSLSDLVSSGYLEESQIKNVHYDAESGKITLDSE